MFFACVCDSAPAEAQGGVDLRLPLVEEALAFIESSNLTLVTRAELLRAGAIRICGEKFTRPGCTNPGLSLPDPSAVGPDAERVYRSILESALATETIKGEKAFDKSAFERYVVDGMVDSLNDPASFFVAPSIYKKIASVPENFVGFGMRLGLDREDIEIAAVHAGSPAERAGLRPGERIVAVSGKSVTGYLRPVALCALWGADGPQVTLTVKDRAGATRSMALSYTTWQFKAFERRRDEGISVLRVRYFERGLETAVAEELAHPETRGLVLDLRGAGGGDESVVVAVADRFLGNAAIGGRRTRLSLGSRTWSAMAETPGERLDLPVAVVIDEHTMGLAEMLTLALKSQARAMVVGRRTAGRITQETLRPLSDGSAVQITSMAFTGPDGQDLSQGVTPKVKSSRTDVVDLAISIVRKSSGPSMDQLVEAATTLVKARAAASNGISKQE
jgi:carboxyl-terminal processing protease